LTNPNDDYVKWLDTVAAEARFGADDKIGTANYIDSAARQRAAESIKTGACLSLARPLVLESDDPDATLKTQVTVEPCETFGHRPPFVGGPVMFGADVVQVYAHGQQQTHLDAINHIGRNNQWYNGFAVDDPNGPDLAGIVNHKLFTRAVVCDIPAVRGTKWVDPTQPVMGNDIDAALKAGGVSFERGDALILYMGRDRYEAAGNVMDLYAGCATPGAGSDAARWLVEHEASLVCWDFLDGVSDGEPVFQVHMLIWAIGLLLVDNCDLGPVAAAVHESGQITGGLVVAPPALPRATGSLVSPLFIQ